MPVNPISRFASKFQVIAEPAINFNDGPFIENPHNNPPINVQFFVHDICNYEVTIRPGEWAKANKKYLANWRIDVRNSRGKLVRQHWFDPSGRKVRVNVDSKSLGDTLAWIPQIVRYKYQNPSVDVYVSHFWKDLGFEKNYTDISFIPPSETLEDCYATFNVGYYFNQVDDYHPKDPRTVPLGEVASDVLGMKYIETRPMLDIQVKERTISDPYVCIATSSTANCKLWLFEGGWQKIINYLKEIGFTVVLIQKETATFQNVIDKTGNIPIQERITDLLHCEFFVGLGSGLSWLAWALGKPVVLISGFSKPYAEFASGCYRVINASSCNGCWNDTAHTFERDNWDWCPRHGGTGREFECSYSITPKSVSMAIQQLLKDNRSLRTPHR